MKYCPRKGCHRAGPDLKTCMNTVVGCPAPVEADPAKVAIIRCTDCDLTRAARVRDIIAGTTGFSRRCKSKTNCKAVLIFPDAPKPKAVHKGKPQGTPSPKAD